MTPIRLLGIAAVALLALPTGAAGDPKTLPPLAQIVSSAGCGALLADAASGSFGPRVDVCVDLAGSCDIAESPSVAPPGPSWWHVFRAGAIVASRPDVVSTLDCAGNYVVTVRHSGGLGLRRAGSALDESVHVEDADVLVGGTTDGADLAAVAGSSGCAYLGPATSCAETHQGSWAAHVAVRGRITGVAGFCAELAWWDRDALDLSTTYGWNELCTGGFAVAQVDTAGALEDAVTRG